MVFISHADWDYCEQARKRGKSDFLRATPRGGWVRRMKEKGVWRSRKQTKCKANAWEDKAERWYREKERQDSEEEGRDVKWENMWPTERLSWGRGKPLQRSRSRGNWRVSLTSPSAMCLCLSFQTLAQRISGAHAALRTIHAGIGMHMEQKFWKSERFIQSNECAILRCMHTNIQTHTPTPESSLLGGPPVQIRKACFPRVK